MTAKELFLEEYSGIPLNQDTVIEMMEEYAQIYMIDELSKEMETNDSYYTISRIEVINHTENREGREYVKYHPFKEVNIQTQDDTRTMKIFLK